MIMLNIPEPNSKDNELATTWMDFAVKQEFGVQGFDEGSTTWNSDYEAMYKAAQLGEPYAVSLSQAFELYLIKQRLLS